MDLIEMGLKYGIAGIAFVLHIPMYKYVWDNRNSIEKIPDIIDEVENVHMTCPIQQGTIDNIKTKIEALELSNAKNTVKTEGLEASIKSIDSKLDKLIEFHMVNK